MRGMWRRALLLWRIWRLESAGEPLVIENYFYLCRIEQRKNIYWLVAGCLLFMALPFVLSMRPPEESPLAFTRPILRDIITNGIILIFFFVNYYFLIPKYYFQKKYILYGAALILGLCAICLLPSLITGRFGMPPPGLPRLPGVSHGGLNGPGGPGESGGFNGGPGGVGGLNSAGGPGGIGASGGTGGPGGSGYVMLGGPPSPLSYFLQEIRHSIYLFVTVILFSILLRVRNRLYHVEEKRIKAELSSLKSQINPHFLFNTLNTIYALAVKRDRKTADAVINLSGLMRYVIKDAHDNRLPLQKELDYLTNYIELQQARLGDTTMVDFTKSGNPEALTIAPLILVSFVENAFKYGVNPEERSEIGIRIAIAGSDLQLEVTNRKVSAPNRDQSTGIGLENTQNRLKLLYPKKHQLVITEDAERYSIHLSMDLA